MQKKYNCRINIKLINEYMGENKLSKREFCRLSKVSHSELKKIYCNNFQFDVVYLYRICKLINVELKEMFERIN